MDQQHLVFEHDNPFKAIRLAQAKELVERYASYAAVGCVIPLPLVEIATLSVLLMKMHKALAEHYELPFRYRDMRAVLVAVLGGATPTGVGNLTTSALLKWVPGANLIGIATATLAASVITRVIGLGIIISYESGEPDLTLDLDELRQQYQAASV
ncbi:DUF697 domain-containing protein [Pokkaliibacter sp. MBI-7]|uniref:DUF697 domain-containing protein n=1 Tax=Proteobacteria bacterium 228 TaxID=2083153 RepID=A0A2S5KP93_9PROT|nr:MULTISPECIES: DUF697 domain-containing protein [Pokkaliibacter]MDH2434864.1 DUF697 domain-containing protein [Pokkaliibacter sp. MBI-7]PPC76631.1 hypothetical protein C4K68_14485 [Pokkaliibacter plantistimulans]